MKIRVINFGYEKLPFRAHENDAGADVYVCFHDKTEMVIMPGETIKIPLGFGLMLADGYAAYVFPRSGIATKGITCELPPIDSGYRGEIHAIVTNCSKEPFVVQNGMRIGQIVITPVVIAEFVNCNFNERGTDGFGSTGI